jgi:lipid A 3-O-deacylase
MASSFRSRVAALAVGVAAAAGACRAQELRAGFDYATHTPEVGASFEADFLFPQLKALSFLGSPRPYVGTQISLQGYTDFAEAGLLWRIPHGRFYLDLGAGLATHNGEVNVPPPMAGVSPEENDRRRHERETRNQFEHRMLYHATFALGWRLSPKWALEFEGQHWSNGHLGTNTNDGADTLGLRAAYRF